MSKEIPLKAMKKWPESYEGNFSILLSMNLNKFISL